MACGELRYKSDERVNNLNRCNAKQGNAEFDFDHEHDYKKLDGVFRYVDRLPSRDIDLSSREIDRYVDLDLRFAWWPIDSLELSLVGQNMIGAPYPEFNNILVDILPTEIQPGVYGAVSWEFQR